MKSEVLRGVVRQRGSAGRDAMHPRRINLLGRIKTAGPPVGFKGLVYYLCIEYGCALKLSGEDVVCPGLDLPVTKSSLLCFLTRLSFPQKQVN